MSSVAGRAIAIVSFAELPPAERDTTREEAELVQPVVAEALARAGLDRKDVGFVCSGSCDYLIGRPFSFVAALDGVAPWPPIRESHVEMDGAWALYEAWVRLRCGDIDTAVVYAYGKSSLGDLPRVLAQQLDPYYLAPLGVDADALAGLQARALVDAGRAGERELASVREGRRISDGAAAIVLAVGDVARRLAKRPAWIRGIDHRIETHQLGARDLTRSSSTRLAAEHAGAFGRNPDVALLHAAFAHEEIILKDALGLDAATTEIPPPRADPMIVAGLTRLGRAASRILDGTAGRALAHATSGPCMQQNLVCVLDGAPEVAP
ncbi:MAG: lipid-transfer protein [Myxococcales bacterium]|nr:lipid-transfer protein [Myxococcales bacterium]